MQIRRAGLALATSAVLAFAVAGCGSSAAGGSNASLPPAPDVSISSSDGTLIGGEGANAKLPANWPAELPVPQGLTLTSALSGTEGSTAGALATYEGPGDSVEILDAINNALVKAGYSVESTELEGEGSTSVFSKEGIKISVAISGDAGDVTLVISVTQ